MSIFKSAGYGRKMWSWGTKVVALLAMLTALLFYAGTGSTLHAGIANGDGVSYEIHGNQITLYWGEKPTGGYFVTIENIKVSENTLTVTYALKAPAQTDYVIQALTYPEDRATIPNDSKFANVRLVRNGLLPMPNPQPTLVNQQTWTVVLNETIKPDSVNSNSVLIYNFRGLKVDGFTITAGDDRKSVQIKPPADLLAGKYTVWISNLVLAEDGKPLPKMIKQIFDWKPARIPVVGSLENLRRLLDKVETAGPGYLNYFNVLKETARVAPAAQGKSMNVADQSVYSGTNVQVAGVDEADVVKTDGKFIYQVADRKVKIFRAYPISQLKETSSISFADADFNPQELYVDGNKLVIIGSSSHGFVYPLNPRAKEPQIAPGMHYHYRQVVKALIYDITDRSQVKRIREIELEGGYLSSRKVGDNLYLLANKWINHYSGQVEENELRPYYRDSVVQDAPLPIDYAAIRYFPDCLQANYVTIAAIDLTKNDPAVVSTFLGAGENVYCSEKNLYIAVAQRQYLPRPWLKGNILPDGQQTTTKVYRLMLKDGQTECAAQGEVSGTILNQFSMDENQGNFRIATTSGETWRDDENTSKNNVYVLTSAMEVVGRLEGIAPGERIYSTRFMGDRLYMVTFKDVDPLFVIDLKNPEKPSILGALKIPGYSDYLHPYDENHIIGFGKDTEEVKYGEGTMALYKGMKIALFDVTDVTKPVEMFKEVIGDRGTDSELLQNHKALLFSREKNLLAFPVTVMKIKSKSNEMPAYGEFEFQGAYVYHLDLDKGFKLKNRITHLTDEQYLKSGGSWYHSDNNVERILYIEDALYTLSRAKIAVHDLMSGQEVGSLVHP